MVARELPIGMGTFIIPKYIPHMEGIRNGIA
jgi:hypothetical protein